MVTGTVFTNEEQGHKTVQIDMVNKPPHYLFQDYEVQDVCKAWRETHEGAITNNEAHYWSSLQEYLMRYPRKNGVEDLRKARWYLDTLIAEVVDEKPRSKTREEIQQESRFYRQEKGSQTWLP